jgi:hypothetical protein
MARPKNLIPTVYLNLGLPEDLHARLTILLFSETENRVPLGGYQEFFVTLLREYFSHQQVDLAPWTGQPGGLFTLRGTPEAVELLQRTLNEDTREG